MDARRAIAELRELDRLTGGPRGARRVCWTDGWANAREFLQGLLAGVPGVEVERDAAGNLWASLEGSSDRTVVVGSHIDSVPAGGWLDGALGVIGGLEVLRAAAEAPEPPRHSVALVDWADEEGARFGHSLFGSTAFAGGLDVAALSGLVDARGVTLPDALAAHGLSVDGLEAAGEGRRDRILAYLELHIEQGPVLEAQGLACGAVLGCVGVERSRLVFEGRAAHAGSTPMDRRHDAAVVAARVICGLQEIGVRHGGVCTAGRLDLEPGIVTVVPGRAELTVDQRHLDPVALEAMLAEARALWSAAAAGEGCSVEAHTLWRIAPTPFDPRLVRSARTACAEALGRDESSARDGCEPPRKGAGPALPSGALHDAAPMAAVAPSAMVFSSSRGGVSHAVDEDTPDADLEIALEAFGRLARSVIEEGVPPVLEDGVSS